MKTKLPQATEHQIQSDIIQYLRMTGWYVMRLNSGKYSVGEGRSKRFIQGQEKGTPDLLVFKPLDLRPHLKVDPTPGIAVLHFIEVKRPGNKQTLSQEEKMKELTEYGAKCMVATCVEDVQNL